MSQTLTANGFSTRPRRVWATGKTINATNGSRTNITTAIKEGDVLLKDPYGFDNLDNSSVTKQIDYTQALTGHFNQPKVIVVGVAPGTNAALAAGNGGWVDVVDIWADAFCNVAESVAVGDVLAVQTGSYKLTAATVFAATNLATFKTLAAKCFIASQAVTYVATDLTCRGHFCGAGII